MKRMIPILLAFVVLLGLTLVVGASGGDQYERNHLEYVRLQNKQLERQNELLREQVVQVKRIADLMEKERR